jgi:hypothetical protein
VDPLHRVITDLVGRVAGPLHFRLLLQPAMATFFGIRDGLKDAREGSPAYFWSLLRDRGHSKERLKSGLKAVARLLFFALVMDAIYQFIALHWFYPGEALIVVVELAFLPYLIIRGPANRIAKWWLSRHASPQPERGASR